MLFDDEKIPPICTISAIALQIRQSNILAEWAMALTTGNIETEQAEAERDGRGRIIVADQLEFIVWRDAEYRRTQVDHDHDDGRTEIQPGKAGNPASD